MEDGSQNETERKIGQGVPVVNLTNVMVVVMDKEG